MSRQTPEVSRRAPEAGRRTPEVGRRAPTCVHLRAGELQEQQRLQLPDVRRLADRDPADGIVPVYNVLAQNHLEMVSFC